MTLLWFCRWFFKSSPSPVLLIRKSSKGGHLLAPIRSASTLHCLHVLPFRSVLGGMASTTTHAHSMSVLPRHRAWGMSPTIMGGSSIQAPPTTTVTTIMATAALLCIMGGHLSAQVSPSVHGGRHAPPRDLPSFVYGGETFPQGHGGYPLAATSVIPSLAFAGSSLHPSLPQEDHRSSSGSDITVSFSSPG